MKPKSYYISPLSASMPIDQNFPKNHQVIGKHKHADRKHFHFIWGPGRSDAHHLRMRIEQISTTVIVFENGSFDNEIFLLF